MSTTNINSLLKAASIADTAALRARLAGEVVVAGDAGYEEARAVQNRVFDRKPAIIARVRGAADVAETVKFARTRGYELAVRGGGHSAAGHGCIDGAIVVDLSEMRGVSIDAGGKTARVQGGATSGDLAGPAHAYGLSVSTGDTASVGLGGLVTGGGIGWMARKHGLAIDNLLSAEVVTAGGEVVRASSRENADLFWAIRGGGGNVGVVTEFEFKLWKDGSVFGGVVVLPATEEVVSGYLDYALSAPDELTTIGYLMHAPPAPYVPKERVGELVLKINFAYAGGMRAGERALWPLRRVARPIAESVGQVPYPVMFDYTKVATERRYGALKAGFTDRLDGAGLGGLISAVRDAPSPMAMVQLRPLGGAIARVQAGATAYAHREKPLLVSAVSSWLDAETLAEPHNAWTERTWEQLGTARAGAYANFLGDEGRERVREAYPSATFAKLALLKAAYDPTNVFKFNQNVLPACMERSQAA